VIISLPRTGYAAVRFTEPNENYHHQHQNVRIENGIQYGDLPQFDDFKYIANVARVNAAALAALAAAPARPKNVSSPRPYPTILKSGGTLTKSPTCRL